MACQVGLRSARGYPASLYRSYGPMALKAQREANEFYDLTALLSGGQWIKAETLTDFLCERPDCANVKSLLNVTDAGEVNAFHGMIKLAQEIGFRLPDGVSQFGDYRAAWNFIQDHSQLSSTGRMAALQASWLSDLIRYALVPQRVNLSAFARDDPMRAWYIKRLNGNLSL